MLIFEHTNAYGFEEAIRGMRNPMNSWDKCDSVWLSDRFEIGHNDKRLMKKLIKAGPEHSKFRRMITASVDITGPLYWWKEFETYKVGTVSNSCSTMHKIHEKEFTIGDFSIDGQHSCGRMSIEYVISALNVHRHMYNALKDSNPEEAKKHWRSMIQLLPSSYNQKRTVMMNYEVLANQYNQRKNHKLDEWRVDYMSWIASLPESWIITCRKENDDE